MVQTQRDDLITAKDLIGRMGTVQWFWHGWLPTSGIVQLFARPGIGKTTIGLHIAGCITDGWPWPDGTPVFYEPGLVYWLNADGKLPGLADKINRLGLSAERIVFPSKVVDLSGQPRAPQIRDMPEILDGLELIEQRLAQMPDLIILDGLAAFHGQEENDSKVALKVTRSLYELSEKAKAPVLLIHHQRKASKLHQGAPAQEGARGSSAWAGAVDMQWHIGARGDHLVLSVTKSNLAVEPSPLAFTIEEDGVVFNGAFQKRERAKTAVEKAEDLLHAALADRDRPCGELREEAEKLGISKYALYEAKKTLGIVAKDVENDTRRKLWSLPKLSDIDDTSNTNSNNNVADPAEIHTCVSDDSDVSGTYPPRVSDLSDDSGDSEDRALAKVEQVETQVKSGIRSCRDPSILEVVVLVVAIKKTGQGEGV